MRTIAFIAATTLIGALILAALATPFIAASIFLGPDGPATVAAGMLFLLLAFVVGMAVTTR